MEANSGALRNAQTCVRTTIFMFPFLFPHVSDNCHGHWATRHVFAFEGFCGAKRKLLDKSSNPANVLVSALGARWADFGG